MGKTWSHIFENVFKELLKRLTSSGTEPTRLGPTTTLGSPILPMSILTGDGREGPLLGKSHKDWFIYELRIGHRMRKLCKKRLSSFFSKIVPSKYWNKRKGKKRGKIKKKAKNLNLNFLKIHSYTFYLLNVYLIQILYKN